MGLRISTASKDKGSSSIETTFVLIIAIFAITSLGGLTQNLNVAAEIIAGSTQKSLGGGTEQTMDYVGHLQDSTVSDSRGSASSIP